jgi:TolB protein
MTLGSWPLIAGFILLAGCGAEGIVTPPPPPPPAPRPGSIVVTAQTGGADTDPHSYRVALDSQASVPLPDSGVRFPDLAAGSHQLTLSDLPINCSTVDNPRTVQVGEGQALTVIFGVTCISIAPVLQVRVTTGGQGADPAGYTLFLDDEVGRPVGLDDTVVFPGLTVGPHVVRLTGESSACRSRPTSPIVVVLAAMETQVIPIRVVCAIGVGGRILLDEGNAIVAVDPTGDNRVVLAEGMGARWSPDGSRIVFVSIRDGNRELYLMNPDGSGQTRLTETAGAESGPAWSPDGRRIAFSSDSGRIGILDLVSGERTTLVPGASPAWSPDGTRIAFNRTPAGGCSFFGCASDLRVINVDGSNDGLLARDGGLPSWSPDGQTIAFQRRGFLFVSPSGLFLRDMNTGGLTRVPGGERGSSAVWASTARALAFVANDQVGGPELTILLLDDPNSVPIKTGLFQVRPTSWR